MPLSQSTPTPCQWFSQLAAALDRRSAVRLALVFIGAVLARGRRTVTSWIRAAGLSADYKPVYTAVAAAGKRADAIAARLTWRVVKPLVANAGRLTFALDDTPTPRYGPQVQGAGVHHNPAPGPAGGPFVYGHVWVVLAVLAQHPTWGVVALPLLARLYVRAKDLAGIDPWHRPPFRTKLELAVELIRLTVSNVRHWGKSIWVVTDGAYAKAAFLKPMVALGVTVVSRLRKDAALYAVPGQRRPGQRGRPRVYGEQRIDLAKRAGQKRGWTTGKFDLYGEPTVKRYKTFVATWRPAGGAIRVVLVDEPAGWRAYFCTDVWASVAAILESVAGGTHSIRPRSGGRDHFRFQVRLFGFVRAVKNRNAVPKEVSAMIEMLTGLPAHTVGFRLSGKLHDEDYKAFTPLVDAEVARGGKVNVLAQFHDFHGWDAHALWDDVKFSTTHCTKINRIALVGEKTWEKWMAAVCKPFTMAKVKYFDASQIDAAKAWLGEP